MKTKITNVRIITGTGNVFEQAEIVFDEQQILEIGTKTGDADRIIDGTGKTVLPGFIDCHTHTSALCVEDEVTVACKNYKGTMDLLKSGITTTRVTGTKYNADVTLRNMINTGEAEGPRILACGEVICITCGHCAEHGYDMDDAIAQCMVEHGTWYIPTAVVTLMEMTYIKDNDELVAKAAEAQKKVRNAVKVAIKNGVKMAVGTDTGCPFTGPGTYAYATELYIYSISGMSTMEALQCATINGAKLLGIDEITGSLETGKQADLIIVDGNPLEDIQTVKNVNYTFRNGKALYINPWASADASSINIKELVK